MMSKSKKFDSFPKKDDRRERWTVSLRDAPALSLSNQKGHKRVDQVKCDGMNFYFILNEMIYFVLLFKLSYYFSLELVTNVTAWIFRIPNRKTHRLVQLIQTEKVLSILISFLPIGEISPAKRGIWNLPLDFWV